MPIRLFENPLAAIGVFTRLHNLATRYLYKTVHP